MGRRSDHTREQLRNMALQAAYEIVEEQGFAGLTARKVAKAIGYTVGSLYLVFRNLDDLIVQINGRTLNEIYAALDEAGKAAPDARAAVRNMGLAYINYAQQYTHRWRMVFEHRLPDDVESPQWLDDRITEVFGRVIHDLAPAMPQASEAQIKTAATALWSGVHGICMLTMTSKLALSESQETAQTLADSLIDNYLDGLLAKL